MVFQKSKNLFFYVNVLWCFALISLLFTGGNAKWPVQKREREREKKTKFPSQSNEVVTPQRSSRFTHFSTCFDFCLLSNSEKEKYKNIQYYKATAL